MTRSELDAFQRRLQGLQKELLGKGPQKIEPNRTDDAKVGADEDEQPLNEMLQSIASTRNKSASGAARRIELALQKLSDAPDDFGLCEDCGEEIGEGRLEAVPYAELCVDCQQKRDRPKGPATRRSLWDNHD
jgi:DnaK suppressor protein